jgi:hypothetical protein
MLFGARDQRPPTRTTGWRAGASAHEYPPDAFRLIVGPQPSLNIKSRTHCPPGPPQDNSRRYCSLEGTSTSSWELCAFETSTKPLVSIAQVKLCDARQLPGVVEVRQCVLEFDCWTLTYSDEPTNGKVEFRVIPPWLD